MSTKKERTCVINQLHAIYERTILTLVEKNQEAGNSCWRETCHWPTSLALVSDSADLDTGSDKDVLDVQPAQRTCTTLVKAPAD
jgi:hypothetical protein